MRVIFMGTPDFAVSILDTLVNEGHEIYLVVTQPDKPVGRKGELTPSPVKKWAEERDLPIFQPERIKDQSAIDAIREFPIDIGVVAAYGQIIPQEILDIPKYGFINVHASLLPKYRGASPIQWSILNGEAVTGVTIMQMGPGLDDGDIILQEEVNISADETGGSLFDKLATEGGNLCCMAMLGIENGFSEHHPQDHSQATYVGTLKKDMGVIDFATDAAYIERMVRAFNPWPTAFTFLNGEMFKIWESHVVTELEIEEAGDLLGNVDKNAYPGTVVFSDNYQLLIKTGKDYLAVTKIQPAGKKMMTVHDYLLGKQIPVGTMLGV